MKGTKRYWASFSVVPHRLRRLEEPLSIPQTSKPDEAARRHLAKWRRLLSHRSCGREVSKKHDASGRGHAYASRRGAPAEYLACPTVLGNKSYLNVVIDPKQVKLLDEKGWKSEVVEILHLRQISSGRRQDGGVG